MVKPMLKKLLTDAYAFYYARFSLNTDYYILTASIARYLVSMRTGNIHKYSPGNVLYFYLLHAYNWTYCLNLLA